MIENLQMIINGTTAYDIAPAVTNFELESSIEKLSDCLKFSIPWSDIMKYNMPEISLADIIQVIFGKRTVYTGFIVTIDVTETDKSYTCYDVCYYLTRSKELIQFAAGMTIREAIIALSTANPTQDFARQLNIPITYISPSISNNTLITVEKTCYKNTYAEILKELLQTETKFTGRRYFARADGFQIRIELVGRERVDGLQNLTLSDAKSSVSMDDIKNTYVSINDDIESVSGEYSDSVHEYGRIIDFIDDEEIDDINKVIEARLANNAYPRKSGTVKLMGDFRCMRGLLANFSGMVTSLDKSSGAYVVGLIGDYIIETVRHSIDDDNHIMTLTLEENIGFAAEQEKISLGQEIEKQLEKEIAGKVTNPADIFGGMVEGIFGGFAPFGGGD